jgi:hypothetical protein
MKIYVSRLTLGGKECRIHRSFFRLISHPMERFEGITLVGNQKEDYELHFFFPDNDYPMPPSRDGELWVSSDNRREPACIKIRCP